MTIGSVFSIASVDSLEISIEVNIPADFLSTEGFDQALADAMPRIASRTKDFWESEAGRRLKTSREAYVNSISIGSVDSDAFSVSLSGNELAVNVEEGAPPYPMNVRRGKIAPLNVNRQVPFTNPTVYRTGTGRPWTHPGFSGVNIVSTVIDQLNNVIIPEEIQKIVEEL